MKFRKMKKISQILSLLIMSANWVPRAIAADSMPGMDHSSMDMGQASPATTDAMNGMNHGGMKQAADTQVDGMQGMDLSASGGANAVSMQGGTVPGDARDPHAYSDGYDFGPIPPPSMADQAYMGSLLINRLERARSSDNTFTMYDLMGRFGKDYDQLVVKAEGDVDAGKLAEARTELLWGHAVAAFWNTQLGVRHDSGIEPDQSWLAIGVQGLAPYWFEVDVTAYVGEQGKTALRLGSEYELLLTQKLILQPRVEASVYGQSDAAKELGSGLSNFVTGVRLRYEIRREFSPYVGVEWIGKFAGTADYARAAGRRTSESRVVAGMRFWF